MTKTKLNQHEIVEELYHTLCSRKEVTISNLLGALAVEYWQRYQFIYNAFNDLLDDLKLYTFGDGKQNPIVMPLRKHLVDGILNRAKELRTAIVGILLRHYDRVGKQYDLLPTELVDQLNKLLEILNQKLNDEVK